MKKLLMATALVAASAASADAYVGINLDFSEPGYYAPAPVYAAPAPVYYEPRPVVVERPVYYGHPSGRWRHRDYDWNYWHHR